MTNPINPKQDTPPTPESRWSIALTYLGSTRSSFDTFGLMAEHRADGQVACNIHIVGGLAGCEVLAQWGEPTPSRALLAISIVRLLLLDDNLQVPVNAPQVTQRFRKLPPATIKLNDGTLVTPWVNRVAGEFEKQFLGSSPTAGTLTISIDEIRKAVTDIVSQLYPDHQ